MSGHSKWHKLKHKKAITDSKKSKAFGQLAQDIKKAARRGNDPTKNSQLREAIQRARSANMPQNNIDRLLHGKGQEQTSVTYEGYGAHGVAFFITASTDNTNRTVAEIRAIFKRHGGSLGEPNSVRWKFQEQAQLSAILLSNISKDEIELAIIEAGANEITYKDNLIVVNTAPTQQAIIESTLSQHGATNITTTIEYSAPPEQRIRLTSDQQDQVNELHRELADHPDVVEIFTDAQPV